MRFLANGPIIPESLLKERDNGQVVFICGAGVSIPSGMPTFIQLTKYVFDHLSPPENSELYKAFLPWLDTNTNKMTLLSLDQIFNLFQLEYGRDLINKLVYKCLSELTSENAKALEHQVITKISTNLDNKPQIVTTNFDRLFEYAIPENKYIYVPPTFPNLQHNVSIDGITYLHGRLSNSGDALHDYILSSSDFGRAYLAQGWATSFIRELLRKHTVVLVGYQAEDPPMKYLLQGLHLDRSHDQTKLFAFDEGTEEEVAYKWRDRGITPIAYPKSHNHHSLWDTLNAWAEKSSNPLEWNKTLNTLSQCDPKKLEPYQRGIVASWVSTASGAKQFAQIEPPPHIEWINVFDSKCRLARPYNDNEKEISFDPLSVYGLDDDPLRGSLGKQPLQGTDYLSWRKDDTSLDYEQRLGYKSYYLAAQIPSRLFYLSQWIIKHIDNPTVAWWVAKQVKLHPRLHTLLNHAVNDSKKLSNNAIDLWSILLEYINHSALDDSNTNWFNFIQLAERNIWQRNTLKIFKKAINPFIQISSPSGLHSVMPPQSDWCQTKWNEIAFLNLKFPKLYSLESLEIPDNYLFDIYINLQNSLIDAVQLLNDINSYYFSMPTLYPQEKPDDNSSSYLNEVDNFIIFFQTIFDRCKKLFPLKLKQYINIWPTSEEFIFDKLRLYAWNNPQMYSGDEVFSNITLLSDHQFWSSSNERELLILMKDRWSDFSPDQVINICEKIFSGRKNKYENELETEYQNRKSINSMIMLGWLKQQNCEIPEVYLNKYNKLKSSLEHWNESWITNAAQSYDVVSGWVEIDEDFTLLKDIAIKDIIKRVLNQPKRDFGSFTEAKPFLGLTKSNPSKAILALSSAMRETIIPLNLWADVISNWPINIASLNATKLLSGRYCQLPTSSLISIRWTTRVWFSDIFPYLLKRDKLFSLKIFDSLIEKLTTQNIEATKSLISQSNLNHTKSFSQKSIDYAMNSPIGGATLGLLTVLDGTSDVYSRLEQLINVPGDGSDHAVCALTYSFKYLIKDNPKWVMDVVIPLLSPNHRHSEAAWSGIFTQYWVANDIWFEKIKEYFIDLPDMIQKWQLQPELRKHYGTWIVRATLLTNPITKNLSFLEARKCLRKLVLDNLPHVIWCLSQIGQSQENAWIDKVIPFIQQAWPQERYYQTEDSANAWVNMILASGDHFPLLLGVIDNLLQPLSSHHCSLYTLYKPNNTSLAYKFPQETLFLLDKIITINSQNLFYELSKTLEILQERDPRIEADYRFIRLREILASS
ncbi:SIR2 family protein [Acinetobacter baumannii]